MLGLGLKLYEMIILPEYPILLQELRDLKNFITRKGGIVVPVACPLPDRKKPKKRTRRLRFDFKHSQRLTYRTFMRVWNKTQSDHCDSYLEGRKKILPRDEEWKYIRWRTARGQKSWYYARIPRWVSSRWIKPPMIGRIPIYLGISDPPKKWYLPRRRRFKRGKDRSRHPQRLAIAYTYKRVFPSPRKKALHKKSMHLRYLLTRYNKKREHNRITWSFLPKPPVANKWEKYWFYRDSHPYTKTLYKKLPKIVRKKRHRMRYHAVRRKMWKIYPYAPILTLRYWGNGHLTKELKEEIRLSENIYRGMVLHTC